MGARRAALGSPERTPVKEMQTTKAGAPTIKDRLEGEAFRKAVSAILPKHCTAERFARVAVCALTRTPKLAECDQASFFGAMMTLSQLGLEPDGRRAHLIPFHNSKRNCYEVQLIVDWKGLAELAMRSGLVSNLHADCVWDGDLFRYSAGKLREHVPWFLRRDAEKPASRGDMYAAYALAEFRDGTSKAEVMSLDDIHAVRRRSKAANAGPWVTDFGEMAKKTVFRRLSKWLPLSPEFMDAIEAEDEPAAIEVESSIPRPIFPAIPGPVMGGEVQPQEPDPIPDAEAEPVANPATEPNAALSPFQAKLEAVVQEVGAGFGDLVKVLTDLGWYPGAEKWEGYSSVPEEAAQRLSVAKIGLQNHLKAYLKAKG